MLTLAEEGGRHEGGKNFLCLWQEAVTSSSYLSALANTVLQVHGIGKEGEKIKKRDLILRYSEANRMYKIM